MERKTTGARNIGKIRRQQDSQALSVLWTLGPRERDNDKRAFYDDHPET
jgi:hypothetical protein